MLVKNGAQFTVYAKSGAAQFSVLPIRRTDKGYVDKDGAILLEVAPGTGPKAYDWSQKISFSIGIADICILADRPQRPEKILHDNQGTIKTLEFTPGQEGTQYEGTFMMSLSQKSEGGEWRSVKVPFKAGHYAVLMSTLRSMVPHLLGWIE